MKAAIVKSDSNIEIKNMIKPLLGPDDILVKMHACGICGSDVEKVFGEYGQASMKLGHEPAGTITEVGSEILDFSVGDRVFTHHHVACYSDDCHECNHGNETMCKKYYESNLEPCGLADEYVVPGWNVKHGGVLKIPDNMSFEEAAMIEPMACALAGQNMLTMNENETILILGSGISGLCHIILSKMKGLKVIATDISDYRINQAKDFGADYALHANEINTEIVREINNGRLADKVIICSGSMHAVESSFQYIDKKGELLFFAVPSINIKLPSIELWRNEISLFFSYGAATNDILSTIELYKQNKITFKSMITHQIALSNIIDGFKLVEAAKDSIKVVINPDQKQ